MKAKTSITLFIGLLVVLVIAMVMLIPESSQAGEKIKSQGNDKTPPGLKKIPPGLEKIVFIHYKKGHAKPDNPGKSNKSPKPSGESKCYDFMGKGVKWNTFNIECLIDPAGSGLNDEIVESVMSAGALEWDDYTSTPLFGNFIVTPNLSWDGDPGDGPDGYNELLFEDYPDSGVIAVTVVWGYFSGPPSIRNIFEFDILFNTYYTWGDASGDSSVMDLQNIATHEIGHGLGLADIYESGCSDVTMYGYSDYGEIQKRDLEQPDIAGLQKLYGE